MATSEAPPLPATTKRPRRKAREVSSRYMTSPSPMPGPPSSPLHSSYSSSIFPKHCRSPSVVSSPDATDSESEASSRFPDENRPFNRSSLETPLPLFAGNSQNKPFGTQRRRAAVRLFGDNGGNQEPPKTHLRKPRPGTPISTTTPKAAVLSHAQLRLGRNSVAKVGKTNPFRSDDTCSENSSTMGDSEVETCSVGTTTITATNGEFCDSPPIMGYKVRQVSEFRSSMPEGADLLPTMSSRRNLDGNENSSASSSICCRSLNMALSSCQPPKPAGRFVPSRICLPPQPPNSRLDMELKKGKKGSSSKQEDVHMLRLLHNKYLQWRFVNSKAKEAVDNRTAAAEKSLYGLSAKISEMQNSVLEKRIELERLNKIRSLTDILEPQMPYLDAWTTVEGEYSSSLTGVTKALQDASLRLPITGNVRADIRDLKEILNSTTNMFGSLSSCIQRFIPKAEGIEYVISDLAKLSSTERSLIEECGNLLSEAHNLQVTECSLRSQLIQAKRRSGNSDEYYRKSQQ